MSDIKEIIGKICPEATFEEGECLLESVPEKKWYPLAKSLKENKDLDFDVLSAVVGMDWKEQSESFIILRLPPATGVCWLLR